jgi:dipeptidyl aminopeptidase/acylaminoacyl peptidase
MLSVMEADAERHELTVMPASGSPRTRLPTDGDVDGSGLWSPDGRHVAYTTGMRSAVWVSEVATGVRTRLAEGGPFRLLGWSAGGESVLVLRPDDGFSFQRVTLGGLVSNVFRWPAASGPLPGVSVVGDTLALLVVPGALLGADLRSGRMDTLYTTPAPERIDSQTAVEASKDGRWAAVPALGPPVVGPNSVHIVPLGGGIARRIPVGQLVWARSFAWHPDGRHLLTLGTADDGAVIRLHLLSLDDGRLRVLSGPDTNYVGDFAIAPDGGTVAFVTGTSVTTTYWSFDFARVLAASQAGR